MPTFATPFSDNPAGEPVVCTSGTRPTGSALYEGMWIWETDTDRTLFYTVTGWVILDEPAQTYTPTMTGWSLGAGTTDFQYRRSDGYCDVAGTLTLGAGFTTGGSPFGISLPVAAADTGMSLTALWGDMFDASAGTGFPLWARLGATNRLDLYSYNAAAAAVFTATPAAAASPMVWAASDFLTVGFRFRMGSRTS